LDLEQQSCSDRPRIPAKALVSTGAERLWVTATAPSSNKANCADTSVSHFTGSSRSRHVVCLLLCKMKNHYKEYHLDGPGQLARTLPLDGPVTATVFIETVGCVVNLERRHHPVRCLRQSTVLDEVDEAVPIPHAHLLARVERLPDACPYSQYTGDERLHATGHTIEASIAASQKRVFRRSSIIIICTCGCVAWPVHVGRGFGCHQGWSQVRLKLQSQNWCGG